MQLTVDELLSHAIKCQNESWATLVRKIPFRYTANLAGIEYIPSKSCVPRHVPRKELQSFCVEFEDSKQCYSPGHYPDRWHKSYTLPLIKHFLESKRV